MGNTVQHKRRNPANCLGCMGQGEDGFDPNELQIGLDGDKARGRVTQQSTAYLTENEKNFFRAASGRNVGLIRFYLNNGININLLDEDRASPLHIACRYGSLQVVDELINNNANLDITDMAGWTPLHVAAYYQRGLVCQQLIKYGCDVRIRNREGNLAQDLVRDKQTSEVFKQISDVYQNHPERQIRKNDPSQKQFDEYFQQLKQRKQKFQECSSIAEKISQSKIISPQSTPNKIKQGEKENFIYQDSLSKSIISQEYEQKEMCEYRELGSRAFKNFMSPCNSLPRFFEDVFSINQLVLWQNQSKERVTFTDQVKFIKQDQITQMFALELFNYSCYMGLSFMIACQLVYATPYSIVQWIFENPDSKNKQQLARLLTNVILQEQQQILKLYVDKIVQKKGLIDSLKELFSNLQIPNDPYLIDILVQEFSRKYYEINCTNNKSRNFPFKSEESLHMFCFAIVIYDIEGNQQDKDNSLRQFFSNISNVNNGDSFTQYYLEQIIEQLQKVQIVNLIETQVEESLISRLNNFATPINLIKQTQLRNTNWKLYRVSDLCILLCDGILKIFQKSNSVFQKIGNELIIQGKGNQELLYLVCKDEQTCIFKQRNKKFKMSNSNDTI